MNVLDRLLKLVMSPLLPLAAWIKGRLVDKRRRVTTRREVAIHEIRHAFIAWHVAEVVLIREVRIHRRGGHCTSVSSDKQNEEALWARIVLELGGIAGQAVLSSRFRSGDTRNDLRMARVQCIEMLQRFPEARVPWKPARRGQIDLQRMFTTPLSPKERTVLNPCYDKACELIARRVQAVERAARELERRGQLSGRELDRYFGDRAIIEIARHAKSGLITFDP